MTNWPRTDGGCSVSRAQPRVIAVGSGSRITISADRLIDKVSQQPYYLAEVQVSAEGVHLLGDYKIKAGMPASVTVKTGERTMLSYLFKPLIARLELAFKEY